MKRIGSEYPAPTGVYKVCVNKKGPWRAYDAARIQVSIGNPGYEGAKLRALCEWCAARFDRTGIVVSDTLRRHNLVFAGMAPDRALATARADGDAWIARNAAALALIPRAEILRWDDLLADPSRRPTPETPEIARVLAETVAAFAARRRVDEPLREAFVRHSEDFLREELSVFEILFRRPAIDIYAGSWIEDLIAAVFPGKDYIGVDFTRNLAAPQAA